MTYANTNIAVQLKHKRSYILLIIKSSNKSDNFLKNKLGISTLVSQETRNGKVVSDKNLPALALSRTVRNPSS